MVATIVHGAIVTPAANGDGPTVQETYTQPQKAGELASAKAFLLARPLGVYTCARAVPNADNNTYHLVLWDFHLTRLAQGLTSEIQEDAVDEATVEALQTATTNLLTAALREAADDARDHTMVTALWSVDGPSIRIDVHVCPMPQVKAATTANVLIHGDARKQSECKHSRWITDRLPLEQHQTQVATSNGIDLHESILSSATEDGDHVLLEGLVTNFFVVKNGSVYTAPSHVLAGSTRELVLRACAFLGIPVVLEAPRLSDIGTWDAAFVTSAVRIVVPVARVLWRQQDDPRDALQTHVLETGPRDLFERLRTRVCDLWPSC